MKPKQAKQEEKKGLQFSLSIDNEKYYNLIIDKLTIIFLLEIDSIIFPAAHLQSKSIIESIKNAQKLNELHNLGLTVNPDLRVSIGTLDPMSPEKFYCSEKLLDSQSLYRNINQVEEEIIELKNRNINGIRIHAGIYDLDVFESIWTIMNSNFERNNLSLHIDRVNLSNAHITNLIKIAYGDRNSSLTLEIDGASSFGVNTYSDTIQTLATADIIIKEFLKKNYKNYKNLEFYLSGAINSKTISMSNLCDIQFDGLSFGSSYNNILFENIDMEENLDKIVENREELIKEIENFKTKFIL